MKKKWRVRLIFVVIVILVAVALYLFFTFGNMYSVQAISVEAGSDIGKIQFNERIDFGDIPQGKSSVRTLIVENTGDNDHSIKIWVIGSIGQLIDVEPARSFDLNAGASQDIDFQFNMPVSAAIGQKYTGRIVIFELP